MAGVDYTKLLDDVAAGLAGLGYHVYRELPAAGAELPAAVIAWPTVVEFHRTLQDTGEVNVAVTIAEATTDWEAAQHAIEAAISYPGSVAKALEQHVPAAGGYRALMVARATNVRTLINGSSTALAVDLELEIITK